MMNKTCINSKLYRLTLEKMVIGVEEPILVKGVGEMLAKIDSGNSGYNVIHGEDLIIQGDIITFKTFNREGDERRVSKKIKDTINVNIGGGHIQERPVVELNIKFGGEDYKKVPFSITNRGDNEHQILISKDFVGKELEALIDVTKDNISNDGIDVNYVTEGIGTAIKNASNSVSNAVGTFAGGTKSGQAGLNKWEARRKAMWGEGSAPEERKSISKDLIKEVEAIGNLEKLLEKDAELIRKRIVGETEKFQKKELNVSTAADNVAVFKIIDYTGGTYKDGENANPEFKKRLEEALKAWKTYAKEQPEDKIKRQEKGEAEEFPLKEAAEPQPAAANGTNSSNTQPTENNKEKENKEVKSPEEEIQGEEGQKNVADMKESEVEEILKDLQNRKQAVFYIINFKKDDDGNDLDIGKDMIGAIDTKVSSWVTKIGQGKDWSYNAFKPAAADIAKDVEINAKGLFALCTNPMESRNVEFFSDEGLFNGEPREDEVEVPEDILEEYNQLNAEYKELGGEGDISAEGLESLMEGGNTETPENNIPEFIQEYNQLNSEYMKIADDMGQPGDVINAEDLQALIELGAESSANKRADELGQTDEGDAYDASNYSYHIDNESEERRIK